MGLGEITFTWFVLSKRMDASQQFTWSRPSEGDFWHANTTAYGLFYLAFLNPAQ